MKRKNDSTRSPITRRQFLQSVVMGVTAVHLTPLMRAAQAGPEAEEIEIIGGTLAALGDGWLEVEEEDHLRRLSTTGDTAFWKGGESTPNTLIRGDEILIRSLAPYERALHVWSNLTRVTGKVTRIEKDGYVLQVGDLHQYQAELLLVVNDRTLVGNPMTDIVPTSKDIRGKDNRLILEGDYLDVIGEGIAEGIRGTTVILYPARSIASRPKTAPTQGPDEKMIDPVTQACTSVYEGYAPWFNCATGAGRCLTCNISNSNQCAWPALDACGCCSSSCCDCSKGCKLQEYASCGVGLTVKDLCSTKRRIAYIADCGPCQKANCAGCSPDLCSRTCGPPNCTTRTTPILDLTKPTFTYFRNPDAGWGCFPCRVSITLPC